MRVMVFGGMSQSLINFRGPLLREMVKRGHSIWASAGEVDPQVVETLKKWGIHFIPINLSRTGMNPIKELQTLFQSWKVMRRLKPDTVLCYTIKPVIWGGLAARMCGIRQSFSLVTGLGYAFMNKSGTMVRLVGWFARMLYRVSLKNSRKVFFQNPDDMRELMDLGFVKTEQCVVLNGSGVDLDHFRFCAGERATRREPNRFSCLLIARLLWDKGIGEYVAAARTIKKKYPQVRFQLAGGFDSSPISISKSDLEGWINEGIIEYLGYLKDVRPSLSECDLYVLPSFYYEGTPRTVLEAMAIGRPIITSDAPGCRETVRPGKDGWRHFQKLKIGANGILVPVKDVGALVSAIMYLVSTPGAIQSMGLESRSYAEERYNVHKVNEVLLMHMQL